MSGPAPDAGGTAGAGAARPACAFGAAPGGRAIILRQSPVTGVGVICGLVCYYADEAKIIGFFEVNLRFRNGRFPIEGTMAKRVSKKQKRVKGRNPRTARRVSLHLVLGDQHDRDRKAAEKMRSFPIVPRLKQAPFPKEREFGFAGHWVAEKFVIQSGPVFVAMNVAYKKQAYYLYVDPRGNRKDRRFDTGLVETNVSLSSGESRELAALVEAGKVAEAQKIALAAGLKGMETLVNRTGYLPAYMAVHPDAIGTLSFHCGLWPVDPQKHCLIGRSGGGNPGRRGLRLLGDSFTTILRHHQAIGLPEELTYQPLENLRERSPDDWAVAGVMDSTVRDELGKLPEGEKILARVDEYQKQAAREWYERFTRAGGYRQREFKKKLARRKKAAERLIERSNRRSTQRAKDGELAIEELKAQFDRERADVTSLQEINGELSNHVAFLESEMTNLGSILKQAPRETVADAAVRLVTEKTAGEEARQENVALKEEVNRLQEIVTFATSLLKRILKFFSLEKRPELSERVQKFEECIGEQVRPNDGLELK